MADAVGLLRQNGFDVEVSADDEGGFWAALRPVANPAALVPRYGRGETEAEAIASAWKQYRVEQIG